MATVAGAPTTAPAQPRRRHPTALTGRAKAERKLGLMLALPAVIVMLLVAGFPILYAFWLSLHRADLRFPQLDQVDRTRQLLVRPEVTHLVDRRPQHGDHHRLLGRRSSSPSAC